MSAHAEDGEVTSHMVILIDASNSREGSLEDKGVLTREADVDFSVHVFPLGGRAEP